MRAKLEKKLVKCKLFRFYEIKNHWKLGRNSKILDSAEYFDSFWGVGTSWPPLSQFHEIEETPTKLIRNEPILG